MLVVWKLNRLGRNLRHLVNTVRDLADRESTVGKGNVRLFDYSKGPRFWAFSLAFLGKESHERNQRKETIRRGWFPYKPSLALKGPSSNMHIGYARVSTHEQNLDVQKDALKKAGCEKIIVDVASGKKTQRSGLDQVRELLRKGDVLVVWRLDRLGRSLKHLIELMTELEQAGIGFQSLQEHIDTTSPGGKLVFHIFGALAEFERNLIQERTKAEARRSTGQGPQGREAEEPLCSAADLGARPLRAAKRHRPGDLPHARHLEADPLRLRAWGVVEALKVAGRQPASTAGRVWTAGSTRRR